MYIARTAGFVLTAAMALTALLVHAQNPVPAVSFTGDAPPPAGALTLWYRQPAADHPHTVPVGRPANIAATAEWDKALPVGNGRLGAMVIGGVVNERLQLNEDTLSAGGPYDNVNPEAHDALPEVRRHLLEGKYDEGA